MSRIPAFELETLTPAHSIYECSATQKHKLGTLLRVGERHFRYAKMGAVAGVAGLMYAAPAAVANHKEQVQTGYTIPIGKLSGVQVLLTTTAPTANQYDDGWLLVNKGTGLSQMVQIKSHDLSTTPCLLELYDALEVATAATSEITLTANKYRAVVAVPTARVAACAGVAVCAVTANYYCWLQVKGPAPLVVDTSETVVLGEPVGYPATPNVAGACGPVGADTDETWGICMQVGAAAEPALVDLKLE